MKLNDPIETPWLVETTSWVKKHPFITLLIFIFILSSSTSNRQPQATQIPIIAVEEVVEIPKEETVIQESSLTATTSTTTERVETQPVSEEEKLETSIRTATAPVTSQTDLFLVTGVVDGDTVTIDIDGKSETLRLIGINTPETVDPRKPVECFGKEASNKAKQVLEGKMVRIENDITQGERDKYGRLLVYIFLEDGTSFNKYMIDEGYAYEYTYNLPYKYQQDFKQAQRNAQGAQKGLWAPDVCSEPIETTVPVTTQSGSHTFYVSSHYSAKFYYCDTDNGWKSLSPNNLKSYPSESALLSDYPDKTLHEVCK